MFLSGSCPVRIALSGRQQKTSQNPTLVAQQSISNFILSMLSRVKSPWFIYILFYQHDSGLCSVCAQTYLVLLKMVMIIIMNDNKDDNDDLMRVLCAHTFLMMMDCTLSWFHKTPFTAQLLHTVHGTQGSYLHNVQRLHIPKIFYTSHVCTGQTIARRALLSGAHSCTASRARKLFSHNSFGLDFTPGRRTVFCLSVLTILTKLLCLNNDITSGQ